MKVRDAMTEDVATATLDTTLDDIASMMKDENVGAIPVIEDGELAGIVTDRDIIIRCIADGRDPSDTTAEDVLSEQIQTIEPDADVRQAALMMSAQQIRRLPVIEDGALIAMISLGDIAVKLGNDEMSGETLGDVSEGVKGGSESSSRRRASRGRQESERSLRLVSGGGGKQQQRRQKRSSSARSQKKSNSRRKAS